MYIPVDDSFDWRAREDAQTLMQHDLITKDPVRLANAKTCLKSMVKLVQGSAKGNSPNNRYSNPATVKKLECNYCK